MSIPAFFSYEKQKNHFVYFFVFLITNSLISFLSLLPLIQWGVGLLGLGIPFYVALQTASLAPEGRRPIYSEEILGSIPWLVPALGFVLMVFLRFYKLENLFLWPNGDEGWNATLAIEFSKKWIWEFFFSSGQVPLLPVWFAAGLLKWNGSPFFSLWFPSATASTLTVLAGYFAARQFFSKSYSLVFAGLLAFSFWPLLTGRLCQQGDWVPLWECCCFFLLGLFLKDGSTRSRLIKAGCLGFVTGLGSFTFTPWPVVALMVIVAVVKTTFFSPIKSIKALFCFFVFLFISLLPFMWAAVSQGYGNHIASVAAWSGWFPWKHQIPVAVHYISMLFWGAFDQESAYTPLWWGFLNPILSSLFFMGLLEILPYRRVPLIRFFFWSFFIFLLPGLLTMNIETFRVIQVMPLLLFMAAIGLLSLLASLPPGKRLLSLFVILALSIPLDLFQLVRPFQNPEMNPGIFGRNGRSLQRFKAYQALSEISRQQGPGLIFTDFDSDCPNDTTLSAMTYPFNAARNPELPSNDARWAALFVNVNYRPYLEARFPGGKWIWVAQDLSVDDGGYLVGIIPLTPENRPVMNRWFQAHQLMQETNLEWYSRNMINWELTFESLRKAEPLVQEDPFLFSIYWEKTAAYYYKKVDFKNCINAYLRAINQGYPTAGLCFKLGDLLLALKYPKEAIPAFQQAAKAPLDLTKSMVTLFQLERR